MGRRRSGNDGVDVAALLASISILDVARRYTNPLLRSGRHVALCPFHSERTPSFQIFCDEGDEHYHCYGCGAHGNALKLVMEAEGVEFLGAVAILKGETEGRVGAPEIRRERKPSAPVPLPVVPVPAGATPLFVRGGGRNAKGPHQTAPIRTKHKDLGDWSPDADGKPVTRVMRPAMVHDYRDKAGNLLCYVIRNEWVEDGKRKKSPIPVSWCRFSDGSEDWATLGLDDPRPVYGAELLGEVEDRDGPRTCVLVEGEKAADAGNRLLGDLVPFLSPLGGTNNFKHADISIFTGWRVITFPDADKVGIEAMNDIAGRLLAESAKSAGDVAREIEVFEVQLPDGLELGWDIADADGDPTWPIERLKSLLDDAVQVSPENTDLDAELSQAAGSAPRSPAGWKLDLPAAAEIDATLGLGRDTGDLLRGPQGVPAREMAGPGEDAAEEAVGEAGAARDNVIPLRLVAPEGGFDFDDLVRRCMEDPRAAFAVEALEALNELKDKDLSRYHMVKGSLRGAKVPMRDLDQALKNAADLAKRLAADRLLHGTGAGTGSIDLRPLGFDRGSYYYYSAMTQQIVCLKPGQHRGLDLFQLAPMSYWDSRYPGDRHGISWDSAASDLMQRCHARGIFDADIVRGLGAWIEEAGSVVMHTGDRLIVDGREMGLVDHDSHYIYERGKPLKIAGLDDPLSKDESAVLLDICSRLRWEKKGTGTLLAGWIALAPICGALEYRPHCWVTAQAGAGKTWIMTNVVQRLLESTALYCQSTSTEAGIRAALGIDARPILFDEAESNDGEARVRMQRVLELMRSATAESGAPIRKSDKDQRQRVFLIRSMAMLSSISVTIKQQADMSRIIVMNLAPPPPDTDPDKVKADQENFKVIEKLVADHLTPEFAIRLLARMVKLAPVVRKNARTLSRAAAAHFGNQRLGDMIGTLLAGAFALDDDGLVSEETARTYISTLNLAEHVHEESTNDERQCLSRILHREHRIELGGAANRAVTRTAAELVVDAMGSKSKTSWATGETENQIPPQVAETQLRRIGIKIDHATRMVLFSNQHPKIAEALADSPWSSGWSRMLKRVPGALSSEKPAYFGPGITTQYIAIPVQQVVQSDVEAFSRGSQPSFAAAG